MQTTKQINKDKQNKRSTNTELDAPNSVPCVCWETDWARPVWRSQTRSLAYSLYPQALSYPLYCILDECLPDIRPPFFESFFHCNIRYLSCYTSYSVDGQTISVHSRWPGGTDLETLPEEGGGGVSTKRSKSGRSKGMKKRWKWAFECCQCWFWTEIKMVLWRVSLVFSFQRRNNIKGVKHVSKEYSDKTEKCIITKVWSFIALLEPYVWTT